MKVEMKNQGASYTQNDHFHDDGDSARPLHKQRNGYLQHEADLDRLKYYNTCGNLLLITLAFIGLYALYISLFIICWVASIMPSKAYPAEVVYIILWVITVMLIIIAGVYGRNKKRKSMQKEAMYTDKDEVNFDLLKA